MELLPGYEILKKIDESRSSLIYRGRRNGSSETIIVKTLKTKYPTPSNLARFQQEYNLIKNLDLDGIIRTYDIVNYQDGFALILEDFDGISLKRVMDVERFDLSAFLKIAVQVAQTLGDLHKEKIVHMDIKPHNILINLKSGRVKITDFGISSVLTHVNDEIYNPDVIEETLLYISPEQTGRMNRTIDYRTDLYSLGVTFYEMLTGQTPFVSNDPMEIMHAHIAKRPVAPSALDDTIPAVVSDIIMMLLAKTAEERYQNAFGLLADLQECMQMLERTGKVESFKLARKDVSIRFHIPQKLYGRERELSQLMSVFERVSQGNAEMMLVAGYPGIGKSALINEIHKPIVEKWGYFISGKYEQFRRDVPYSSIIQAFARLVRQILSENEEKEEQWRRDLLAAMGSNGKVMTNVIPTVELIIGQQPEVPELGPEEAQNRFNFVFRNFTKVFAKREHPLVLFLDDLQWADYASLQWITMIMTDPEIRYFFLIGAYRDNEVVASHPLNSVLDEMRKMNVPIHQISLLPLNLEQVNALIAEFIRSDASRSFAELVYKKTNGNPFFISQFVKTLYEDKLLRLDPDAGWVWDVDSINRMQVTDNVVDLMASKIIRLKEGTREILEIGACIGNRFDLETLSLIVGKSTYDTLADLSDAIQEGFVGLTQDIYVFQHDRIQEAAYSLIPEDKRIRLHYKIGTMSLENTRPEHLQEKIFYIVNQLNQAVSLIVNRGERDNLARLNLAAGQKAKDSAAYRQAFHYLKTGIDIMGEGSWDRDYDLTLSLHNEGAQTAYLSTGFGEMERLSSEVLKQAMATLDKVRIYKIRMATAMTLGQPRDATNIGLEFLALLKIRFPKKPQMYHVLIDLIKTKIMLIGKRTEELINLPAAKDPHALAAINILASVGPYAYFANAKLSFLTIFKLMMLTIRYGNTPESPYAYSQYGGILCGVQDIESGYQFGKLALELVERTNISSQSAIARSMVNIYVRHWKDHVRDTLKPLHDAHQLALETGNFEFATFSGLVYCYHAFYGGKNLRALEQEISTYAKTVYDLKHETSLNLIRVNHQMVLNLLGEAKEPWRLVGPSYDEEKVKPGVSYYSYKLIMCCLFGQYTQALENGKKAERRISAMIATFHVPIVYFYDSLTRLALYHDTNTIGRWKILAKVRKNQRKMKRWAHHGPMNHLHKYYLVEAEVNRVLGKDLKVMECFDKAITLAQDQQFIQEEALGNELAARFCLARGRDFIARSYMNEARMCYQKWGATVKVRQLDEKYPQWFASSGQAVSVSESLTNTTGSVTGFRIDLGTLKKSLKIIAEEKIHSRMIEKTIRTAIEFAGAQKGLLLLRKVKEGKDKEKLYIEAEGYVDSEKVSILQSIPVENSSNLSLSVVNYVMHTKESVVIHNAQEPQEKLPQLQSETYIKDHLVRSILCLPIMVGLAEESELIGLLYLENNLATNTFTEERIETLEIICLSAAGRMELSQRAATDGLTGLYNHDYFQNMLQQELLLSTRHNRKLSLIMIDIDHFKKFNDLWGHQVGDLVLQEVAHTINDSCRKTDIVARYGGEEMAVILPETSRESAVEVAERIRKGIESMDVDHENELLKVTISIGVSGYPIDARDPASLIRKADMALYISKDRGRNRVTEAGMMPEIN